MSFPAVTALALYDEIDENACRDCSGALASLHQHRRHTEFVSRTAIGRGSIGRKLMAAWGFEFQQTAGLEVMMNFWKAHGRNAKAPRHQPLSHRPLTLVTTTLTDYLTASHSHSHQSGIGIPIDRDY